MAGCFGTHWVDRAMEQQLMNHLNNEDMEDELLEQDAEDFSRDSLEAKKKNMDYLQKIHGNGPIRNEVWDAMCYYSKYFNVIVWRDGRADIVRNADDVLLETALIDINSPRLGVNAVVHHAYQNYKWF